MKAYSKWVLIVVIVIAAGGIAGRYFYNCVQYNPLFFSDDYSRLDYWAEDRLRFCWNMLFQPRTPKGPDYSVEIPIMGPMDAFLIEEGREHPPYNSSPPTSGWNYSFKREAKYAGWRTIRNKTFSSSLAISSEVAVARLYRGFVWITFKREGEITNYQIERWQKRGITEEEIERRKKEAKRPGVSEKTIEKLKELARGTPLVFISSRQINGDADIAISALGRQDKFNLENGELSREHIARIWDFILRYRDKVPPGFGPDESAPFEESSEEGTKEFKGEDPLTGEDYE